MTRTQYYLSYPQGFVYLAGDMGWALEVGCHHSHSINAGSVGWLEGRQTFQHQGAGWSGEQTVLWDWYLDAPVTFQRLWFFVLFAGANKTKKQMSYTYLFIMMYIFYLHRNYYYNSIWAFEQCDLDVTLHCCPFESISISRCFQGLELPWSYPAICSFWKQHFQALLRSVLVLLLVSSLMGSSAMWRWSYLKCAKVRFLVWNHIYMSIL